jgi:hypothetical protein
LAVTESDASTQVHPEMSRHRYGFVLSAILLGAAVASCGSARDSCGDPPEQTELDLDPPPSGVCPSRAQALRLFASQQPGTVILSLDSDGALMHEPATYSCCYEIGFGEAGVDAGTQSYCGLFPGTFEGGIDASVCPPPTDGSLQFDVTSLWGSDAKVVGDPTVQERPAHDECVYEATVQSSRQCNALAPL